MLLLKILGIVDIITALAIFMNADLLFLVIPLFLIHFIKGILSMGADWIGRIYGIIDLVSAAAILFVFSLPFVLESFIVIVLLFKGVISLF